jgi:hypothetical protein
MPRRSKRFRAKLDYKMLASYGLRENKEEGASPIRISFCGSSATSTFEQKGLNITPPSSPAGKKSKHEKMIRMTPLEALKLNEVPLITRTPSVTMKENKKPESPVQPKQINFNEVVPVQSGHINFFQFGSDTSASSSDSYLESDSNLEGIGAYGDTSSELFNDAQNEVFRDLPDLWKI